MATSGRHPTQAVRRRAGHPGGPAGLLGSTSEARWLRYARAYLRHLFPYLPGQSGYNKNKRLRRAASLIRHAIRAIAVDTALWSDDVWIVDSTPVECGRSRETTKRSDQAGWACYGWCASHSRWFWGLRLHLVCTLHGLPVTFALADAKAVDREVLMDMLAVEPDLLAARPGQLLLADKNYDGTEFEGRLVELGCGCCARRAKARSSGPAPGCCGRCGS